MAKEYIILDIREVPVAGDLGITKKFRVIIKSTGGTVQTVDVELDSWSPEKAHPILKAEAENSDAIRAL